MMQQLDKGQFLEAAKSKVKSHVDNEHFVLMKRERTMTSPSSAGG
jgi:hypothetical protein